MKRYCQPVVYCAIGLVIVLEVSRIIIEWVGESPGDQNLLSYFQALCLVFLTSTITCVLLVWVNLVYRRPGFDWVKLSILLALFCIATALGVYRWDDSQSSDFQPADVFTLETEKALKQAIPETATVFWPSGMLETWFLLERSFYASKLQGAGWVFSRDAALELYRRQMLLLKLGFTDGEVEWNEKTQVLSSKKMVSQESIYALCSDSVLTFIIFPTGISDDPALSFNIKNGLHFYLLDCNRYR